MEDIKIPSPSAFLSSPVQQASSLPPSHHPAKQKRKSVVINESPVEPKKQTTGITKPKQSKSRNGMLLGSLFCSYLSLESRRSMRAGYDLIASRIFVTDTHIFRLRDLQSEAIEMRRDEAILPAMSQEERSVWRV